ncbi:SURF1 family protein [Oceanimonas sp. CHS3-5]|uniref:SURF1 family protein n=1 Tax=Oceanimonas sp. CHS3-5 TaxID=3068186 RepID=UPI00273D8274|nr:SURF1 family protein [Oceanimonas sp. CHS3-5]MDP5292809.1 SURF1 family protein [Oceanimonas sp. CHS3-5]
MSIGKRGGLLVLTAAMTGLMVFMGVWQLSRADEKRRLLQEWEQRSQVELELKEAVAMQQPFGYRLRAGGVFLAGGELFLDNQIEQGRPGYRLIRPLQTPQGLLAVDWGWLPADADRRQLPQVDAFDDAVVLVEGVLVRPWQPPLELGSTGGDSQFRRIASLDTEALASRWGQPVLPMVLKTDIDAGSWQPVVMGPEKHLGYAVQWFAMTIAIWLAAWWWNGRRHEA